LRAAAGEVEVDTGAGSAVAVIWAAGSAVAVIWAAASAALIWAAALAEAISPVVARLSVAALRVCMPRHAATSTAITFIVADRFGFGGGYEDWCYEYPYYTPNCYLYGD
jgi:predicted PurR-regulated permease PerM